MLCCGSKSSLKGVDSPPQLYRKINNQDLKLVQLQVLFRHGARTPINFIRGIEEATYDASLAQDLPETMFCFEVVRYNDGEPAGDSLIEADLRSTRLKGGCYASMLTTVGQRQMYEMGKTLRDVYLKDLDIKYFSTDKVRVRTTHLTRTIKSLRCVLAGMFGNENLNSMGPLKFYVKSIIDEDLFPNKLTCPAMRLAIDVALSNLSSIASFSHDRLILLKALNQPLTDPLDFSCVRDDIVCRVAHGLPYPPALLPYRDMIESNAAKTIHAVYSGKIGFYTGKDHKEVFTEVTKLAIGRLVHTIVTEMESFTTGDCKVKLYLYSAHDTSIAPMLEALGIWDFNWPPFASSVVFELYERERDSHYFVRVLYRGESKTLRDATNTVICFNEFKKILQKFRLPHFLYPKACMVTSPSK